jgi:hypothetical protein
MKTPIKTAAAAAFLAIALALTSCASQEEPKQPAPAAEQTTAPNPTVGDTVDATRAAELNEAQGATRAYELTDGTFVLVDSTAPLPENVAADFEGRLAAIPTATGPADSEAVELAVDDLAYQAKVQTGRNFVVISKLWVSGNSADSQLSRSIERWIHVGDSRGDAFEPWGFLLGNSSADDYAAELKAGVVGDPQYDLFIHGR